MPLTDFFRINLPYGVSKNIEGKWVAFNREYLPIGFTNNKNGKDLDSSYLNLPLGVEYKGLTETFISKLVNDPKYIKKNESGEIERFFLYDDTTNPFSSKRSKVLLDIYFNKLESLSSLVIKDL